MSLPAIFRLGALALTVLWASAATADDAAQPILQGPVQTIPGPLRTVAVGQIDDIGAQAPPGTGWNVGGSLAAMLNTALQQSGRFIVVERNALAPVLGEQKLTAAGATAGSAAPRPGQVIPAQYLVVGSVTAFSTGDKGGGVNLGGASGLFNGALSLSSSKGSVGLDLRVIDTSTSQQVAAFQVSRTLSSTQVNFSGGYQNMTLGTNQFWNTPLGDATRGALTDAVGKIATAVASGKWQGAVVEANGNQVYVNGGANIGLKAEDRLDVVRIGKVFTDPTTGAVLDEDKMVLGTVQLDKINDKLASGRYQAADRAHRPARGDLVVMP